MAVSWRRGYQMEMCLHLQQAQNLQPPTLLHLKKIRVLSSPPLQGQEISSVQPKMFDYSLWQPLQIQRP